jgi:general secretion pathway protein J
MLLATSLLAFIMLMVYSSLDASVKLASSGESEIERAARARIVHEFLRKQLTRMMPLNFSEHGTQPKSFEGEATRIRWIGPMPGYLGSGGPYVQELGLERAADGTALLYRFALFNGYEDGDLEVDEPVALIEGLRDVRFSFRGVDNTGQLEAWSNDWSEKNNQQLPIALKIDFSVDPKSRLRLPDLEVPVLVDANVLRPSARFSNSQPSR